MSSKKRFTRAEELANAISHGIGLFLAIAATTVIVMYASIKENAWLIVSTTIYGASLITLYFSSTMNHSLKQGKAKEFFHNFDQIAIYFLIAGTYTPMALSVIRNESGWLMFGLEWGLAITGILAKVFLPNKFEKGVNVFIIISYVLLGLMLLFFLNPLIENLSLISLVLIFAGGVFYLLGIIFFKLEKKLKFSHLIWHLMVIGGSVCHWIAIFIYVLDS